MIVKPRIVGLGVHSLVPLLARINARIAERRRALAPARPALGRGAPMPHPPLLDPVADAAVSNEGNPSAVSPLPGAASHR